MAKKTEGPYLKVADFMSAPVVTIDSKVSLADAVKIMTVNSIGNIVVANGKKVEGIITERELLQYLVLYKSLPNKQVKYVMTQKFTKVTPRTSIVDAAKTMISKKSRILVFRDRRSNRLGQLAGILTASDLVRAFLETKGNPTIERTMAKRIFTLKPGNTVLAAAKMMLKKRIGSVVVSSNGHPYSIFTERDLLNRVLGQNIDIEENVGLYGTSPALTASYGIGASDAAKLMFAHKMKRLPLTKDGEIVAIVTARDLVEAFQKGVN